MKNNFIYISCLSVLALFSACTGTSNDPVTTEPARGTLKITARDANGNDGVWENFKNGSVITVYNSYQISNIAPTQKGKYRFDGSTWVNEPTDNFIGLWPDAITMENSEIAYFFTATFNTEADGVTLDQTNKNTFATQDFCVARAIYKEKDDKFNNGVAQTYWQETGIFLHFRHVLSKLRVNLYLPLGDENDGYFDKNKAINNVKMNLKTPYTQYTVNYGTSLLDSEIADVTTGTTKASKDLQMCASEVKDNTTVPGTSIPAKKCSFEAIIPNGQVYQKDNECLTVTLTYNGSSKTYTYSPPSNTTMLFQQEKVTVVNLTLMASKPNQIVLINSVSLQDWSTDEADMDLISVPGN